MLYPPTGRPPPKGAAVRFKKKLKTPGALSQNGLSQNGYSLSLSLYQVRGAGRSDPTPCARARPCGPWQGV